MTSSSEHTRYPTVSDSSESKDLNATHAATNPNTVKLTNNSTNVNSKFSELHKQNSHLQANGHGFTCSGQLKDTLRWIIHNNQIDDFADMLCTDIDLKIYVINQCAKHHSTFTSCLKFGKKWKLMDRPECRRAICKALAYSTNGNQSHNNRSKKKHPKHAVKGVDDLQPCHIDMDKILFVTNEDTLKEARTVLLKEKHFIGLDLECMVKQFPIHNPPKRCQILQIATTERVVIFDLAALPSKYEKIAADASASNTMDPALFDDLMYQIFYNPSLLKIGMQFDCDLALLRKQYPYLKCFKCIIKSYLELKNVLHFVRNKSGQKLFQINNRNESAIKYKSKEKHSKREGGLGALVRHTLKMTLDKKEQLSNWARRPLRLSQLQYAALDAHVCVLICQTLQHRYPGLIETNQWITDFSRY